MLQGKRITARDGVCVDARGTLAGSDLDMALAVRNAIELLSLALETAFVMASKAPASFLGLQGEYGTIAAGKRADLVLLDGNLVVRQTWIEGQRDAFATQ